MRHFLDIHLLPPHCLRLMIEQAKKRKKDMSGSSLLQGKTLAMIFEKPSLRTHVSFDVAMKQLGGQTTLLMNDNPKMKNRESLSDMAQVLSGYVHVVMMRTLDQSRIFELAQHSQVPVINGLTDQTHPCQIMADILTIEEHKGPIDQLTLTWIGDGNNVATSFIQAAHAFNFSLRLCCPESFMPPQKILDQAKENKVDLQIFTDPLLAAKDSHVIITDTWVSMGTDSTCQRLEAMAPYRVTQEIMKKAHPQAIFLHCLPAYRGQEVEESVIDGPQSVVFQEAENRLHIQKEILLWCLNAKPYDISRP